MSEAAANAVYSAEVIVRRLRKCLRTMALPLCPGWVGGTKSRKVRRLFGWVRAVTKEREHPPNRRRITSAISFFTDCAQIQPIVLLWQFLSVILTAVLLYGGNYKRPIIIGRLWVFLHGVKITKGRFSVRTSSRSRQVRNSKSEECH